MFVRSPFGFFAGLPATILERFIYIYICIYIHICVHICIYIYNPWFTTVTGKRPPCEGEKEGRLRNGERERGREGDR